MPPRSRQPPKHPAPPAWLTLPWALGRMFLLLALVYLLRHPLLNAVESAFDIIGITEFAIDRVATPLTRVILAAGAALGYFLAAVICERLFLRHAYLLSLAAATAATAAIAWKLDGGPAIVAFVALLLATNWARFSSLKRIGLGATALARLIAIPPAVAEVLLASRYLDWLASLPRRTAPVPPAETPQPLPGAVIAALTLAILIPGTKLFRHEQSLRSGPDVRVFAHGDFNDIALDARENRLLATGHGLPRVHAYDLNDLTARPLKAQVETGAAQAFEFDPAAAELFVYDEDRREILVLETHALALKRAIPAPTLSSGDPWIKCCRRTGTLTIASEADEQGGDPFVVYDVANGTVLDKLDLEAGNLLLHPDKPILYANFFRRVCGVVAYDLQNRRILARTPTDARTDRMAFDPVRHELLMASPAEGRIQSFDALTLQPKGPFKAIMGVRVITVDEPNDRMLVASLLTGKVALMGLTDRKVKRTWYLGPWLRSIVIAPGTGIAYVSSQKSLYELRYAHRN